MTTCISTHVMSLCVCVCVCVYRVLSALAVIAEQPQLIKDILITKEVGNCSVSCVSCDV